MCAWPASTTCCKHLHTLGSLISNKFRFYAWGIGCAWAEITQIYLHLRLLTTTDTYTFTTSIIQAHIQEGSKHWTMNILHQSTLPNISKTFFDDLFDKFFFTLWRLLIWEYKHLLPCLTVTFRLDLEKLLQLFHCQCPQGGPGRTATQPLTTWSQQSGLGLVALVTPVEAIWNKCLLNSWCRIITI